jgi:hypothetical protein
MGLLFSAVVTTEKDIYTTEEQVTVSFEDVRGEAGDWMAIYPAGSTNDYGNIVKWSLTGGTQNGEVIFPSLSVGEYDIRLFYGADVVEGANKQIVVNNGGEVNPDTSVQTTKDIYTPEEEVVANIANMSGDEHDWIGIYPAGSDNAWENVVDWKWIAGDINTERSFNALPVGEYEVRVFFANSFDTEASCAFSVEGENPVTTVKTAKDIYAPDESIIASFENMSGHHEDWIAIYPVGSDNAWENMIDWKWIAGDIDGNREFNALPAGEYEVRVFFENSFDVEASYAFQVDGNEFKFSVRDNPLDPYELVRVDFENMPGLDSDWIGIFEVGVEDAKETAIQFKDTNNQANGELTFNGLPAGEYEVRAYFQGERRGLIQFTVQDKPIERVLYDDFEADDIDPRWTPVSGHNMTLLSVGVPAQGVESTERKMQVNGQRSLRTYRDYRNGLNYASYYFDFENPDKKFKFLELDMKIGVSSHVFSFGVKLKTKLGDRRIEFASYLNHTMPDGRQIIRGPYGNVLEGHSGPYTKANGYLHVHPGPSDYYVGTSGVGAGTGMFIYYKINIEEKLRLLEPDNELLGITYFVVTGGDYDNLALTTH